jgi:hypothetical protein
MKKLPLLLLLFTVSVFSQVNNRYVKLDFSFDPNSAFNVIDNPRMVKDHKGFDFDLELGASDKRAYAYIFYGRFEQADYQNYGLGADYLIVVGDNFELNSGAGVSVIMRKQMFGERLTRVGWGSTVGYHIRMVGDLRLSDHLALTSTVQYQRRPDIGIGIMEFRVGVSYRIYRKF